MSIKISAIDAGTPVALRELMLRGMVTECDFEAAECAFPGIVSYYRDLKEKPDTFLELLWGFMHQECACAEPLAVATRPAMRAAAR